MLGTFLSAAYKVGSSLASNAINRKNAKDMASYQNDLNIKNWRSQIAYNSPVSQMQRLRSAGLNPNLIYQGDAITPAGGVPAPSLQNPTMDFPNDVVNDYVNLTHAENESKSTDSVIKTAETQRSLNNAYEQMSRTQQQLLHKELPWKDRMLRQEFVNSQLQGLLFSSQANKLEAETGYTRRQIDNFYRSLENQFANDRVQRAVGLTNIKQAEKLIDEINQKILESNSRIKNLKLEYLRGDIARQLEQYTFEFQTNPSIHGGKSRMQDQWETLISEGKQRVKKLEFENSNDFRYVQMFKGWNRSVEPSTRVIHKLIDIHNKYK